MFLKALSSFFVSSNNVAIAKAVTPKAWLDSQFRASGLAKNVTKERITATKDTAKVFFNVGYFPAPEKNKPFSLARALTKTPAICVEGDKDGVFQNGLQFPICSKFFQNLPLNHSELLSPTERLSSGKKIIFSKSAVFASGGYPFVNPRRMKEKTYDVGIFSLAGASFENTYLHYRLFMLDPINKKAEHELFAHLYKNGPTDFKEAQSSLGKYDATNVVALIRTGFPYLARADSDQFYSSFSKKNAVIFLKDAYFRHQLEDISLLLTAVNDAAEQEEKPALLKATAVGMGYFAKVNREYDIQHVLYPIYLRTFKKLLSENKYPWIAKVEFPTFSEQQSELFELVMSDYRGDIDIYESGRDVLEFSVEEQESYFPCSVNPSDSFAYVGNEWDINSSVEAMMGLNSSLRFDQIPLENPLLLTPEHHIPVVVYDDFSAKILTESKRPNLSM
jgi:hypothetical protein